MTTNKHIDPTSELHVKGAALLKAAHEYWEQYRKDCGTSAVVWLEADNGHFILFTRSEYKNAILASATRELSGEPHLFKPF